MEEKNLILVSEGQVHTIEYMHKNKVYPKTVVFDCTKFKELAPYLSKNDEVLVVINGATDFSLAMIYALLRDLENVEDKVSSIRVMSNVDLGKIDTPYYLYKGDLFYGEVVEIRKGKVVPKEDIEEQQKKGILKGIIGKKQKQQGQLSDTKNYEVNEVMQNYLKYNKNVKLMIHGITKKETKVIKDEFINKLIEIDLFKQT